MSCILSLSNSLKPNWALTLGWRIKWLSLCDIKVIHSHYQSYEVSQLIVFLFFSDSLGCFILGCVRTVHTSQLFILLLVHLKYKQKSHSLVRHLPVLLLWDSMLSLFSSSWVSWFSFSSVLVWLELGSVGGTQGGDKWQNQNQNSQQTPECSCNPN